MSWYEGETINEVLKNRRRDAKNNPMYPNFPSVAAMGTHLKKTFPDSGRSSAWISLLENGHNNIKVLKSDVLRELLELYQFSEDQMAELDEKFDLDLPVRIPMFIDIVDPNNPTPKPTTPGGRLRSHRESMNLTRQEMSDLSGVALGHITRLEEVPGTWERSSKRVIEGLAKALKLSSPALLDLINDTPYPSKPNVFTDQVAVINPNLKYGTRKIPKYTWVGMGPGGRDSEIIGYVDIPETWNGDFFSYDARGDSMTPHIPDGTELIIRKQEVADPNDVVLAWLPEEGMLLKVFSQVTGDGLYILSSFNTDYQPIVSRDVRIYGILWETRNAWKANGRRRA